jgi:hypothetical protein
MRTILLALSLLTLVGCAAFEQTPDDLQRKISEPTKGQLYTPEPAR